MTASFFSGDLLPINERQIVYGKNGSLLIKRVARNDAGTYVCSVDNDAEGKMQVEVMGELIMSF